MVEPFALYGELAPYWPLISPVEEYREEAAWVSELLRTADRPVREVLELGSGGGHNAYWLRRTFTMTLVDRAPRMLEVSRALNPDCRHVEADLRHVRLGRVFDAVFVHDAIAYAVSEAELARAMGTARAHCRPGGVALFVPDDVKETFEPGTASGGGDHADGHGVRYLEWTSDPDPEDDRIRVDYAFLLRGRDGAVRALHEAHENGLFAQDTWIRCLREAGFDPEVRLEATEEDRPPRHAFLGRVRAPRGRTGTGGYA